MSVTQREAILLAALEFRGVFTMGDLVDAVWKRFPDMFRLSGYDLPNNQYVESKVYGTGGLVERGQFEQTRPREFRVTAKGRSTMPFALTPMLDRAAFAARPMRRRRVEATPTTPAIPVHEPIPVKPLTPVKPPTRSLWANHLPIR